MVIKTSNPMIKIFTSSSNSRAESKNQSPRSLKPFALGGVGLGIVAALESSGDDPSRIPPSTALFGRNLSRSKQFPTDPPKVHGQGDFRLKAKRASLFQISPTNDGDFAGKFPASDFLSSCNMCQKKLHGRDIYMYRGEKAFCSSECRYNQIVIDERREKYYSKEVSRQVVVDVSRSSSPCVNGQKQIYATGILAS